MISVVLLNFSRPDYINNTIIDKLDKIPEIDEIVISHGKKSAYFKSNNHKVKNLIHYGEMNKKYGLTLRFLSALEAKNNIIIIMDDDIYPTKKTVKTLIKNYKDNPKRLYGIYGRLLDENNNYTIDNVFGDVHIVLTRLLITDKEMCKYFIDNYKKYEIEMIKKSKPFWNGEDILFSLLSYKKYGNLPRAIDLSHNNRLANYLDFGNSISLNNEHFKYRQNLSKELVKELKINNKNFHEKKKIDFKKSQFYYFLLNSNLIYYLFLIILLIIITIFSFKHINI
jgi:hypothetical protein